MSNEGAAMKTVFISYSSKDKETAAKVKTVLEANGIDVTIDSESLVPGRDIRAFIDKSIRETDVTLSIVSKNSLLSDWVALETVDSLMAERLLDKKQFIPCFIDEEFLKNECLTEATRLIDEMIANIDQEITTALSLRTDLTDLQSIRTRKLDLRHNLSKILNHLREKLTLDIREPLFDQNMRKIINAIDPDAGRYPHHRYLNWLRKERVKSELKYTELSGRTQRKPELQNLFRRQPGEKTGIGERFAVEARHERLEPFEDAVAEILTLRRAVLLGDPGSGKSTTLWKLAGQLCDDSFSDPEAPLPVLVRLGFWTSAEEPLTDFITRQSGPLPASIDQLLGERRVVILLDGMNEIPTGQWKTKYEEISEFIATHQDLIVVVSCRELDYKVDLGLNKIVILPLDPIRIRHFVDDYLGAERGESLFWKLVGGDGLKIHQRFINQFEASLEEAEQTFWLARQLPKDTRFWDWGDWIALRDNPGSLLVLSRNPFMLNMICEIYDATQILPENKGKLFHEFVEVLIQREINSKRAVPEEMELLLDALSKLAYEMQINPSMPSTIDTSEDSEEEDEDVDEDHDDPDSNDDSSPESDRALTSLRAERVRELIGARLLELALSANLLSGDEEIRFAHQLLQEYFTAIYMEEEISSDRMKATQIWPAESWWERTNWEVATRLLAGLHTDDCSKVVNWVAEANPEVAAECIVLSGAALAPATKKKLRKEWRSRLVDPVRDPDPRARAAVGRALGLTGWDNRDGIGTVEREIDGQKIQLPDFEKAWIEIPAGEFTSGPLIEFDFNKGGYIDSPTREVTLPSFKISRYPVTFVQFQTFVDDPEGYQNQDRWFEGLAASEDDRRLDDQYFRIEGKAYSNDPRENINWYQAVAFCRWLSWRFGGGYDLKKIDEWIVRLPTELEWERAARGLEGRIYPYGNEFDSASGNTFETGIGRISAVGIFPSGASPDGVLDMSGNVDQWCLNSYDSPEVDLADIDLSTEDLRSMRGGAWKLYVGDIARTDSRNVTLPSNRSSDPGFRVVSVVRPPS
jgi:formylglycine-generating enzyme required for sulfatase activity